MKRIKPNGLYKLAKREINHRNNIEKQIKKRSVEKIKYNKRVWLNSENIDSTGSIVAVDGKVTDLDNGNEYTQRFLEIADCRTKIRLHQTSDDSKDDFVVKMKLLKNEIDLFIKHLEK